MSGDGSSAGSKLSRTSSSRASSQLASSSRLNRQSSRVSRRSSSKRSSLPGVTEHSEPHFHQDAIVAGTKKKNLKKWTDNHLLRFFINLCYMKGYFKTLNIFRLQVNCMD